MHKRQPYPTDMTDDQWTRIAPWVAPKEGGRTAEYERRDVVNAILYVLRTGCQWRNLPHDFPPWSLVYSYFRRWKRDGTYRRMNDALREEVRKSEGRDPQPSAGSIDSQSVKASETSGAVGFDVGKQVKGKKRHMLVDVLGLLIAVVVTTAAVQDRDGGKMVVGRAADSLTRMELLWADGAYASSFVDWVKRKYGWRVEITAKPKGQRGFVVLPRRWVVERTHGWVGRNRRMSRDFERTTSSSESMVYLSMISLMTRRLDCSPEGEARRKSNQYSTQARLTAAKASTEIIPEITHLPA